MLGQVHPWLRARASRWTVLRTIWFMQNFATQPLAPHLDERRLDSPTQDRQLPVI